MPLTLRKFSAQVRDETTGDMIPAGLLSSDALGAINTAKTDAVSAIELKGATTLASIPNDYTALQGEVDDLETQISLGWTAIDAPTREQPGFVRWTDGSTSSSSTSTPTEFIDIHNYSKIKYKQQGSTSGTTAAGMFFYDESYQPIPGSGIQGAYGQSEAGYVAELKEAVPPNGAYYARFTTYTNTSTYGEFAVYGTKSIGAEVHTLQEQANKYILYEGELTYSRGIYSTTTGEISSNDQFRYGLSVAQRINVGPNNSIKISCDGYYIKAFKFPENGTTGIETIDYTQDEITVNTTGTLTRVAFTIRKDPSDSTALTTEEIETIKGLAKIYMKSANIVEYLQKTKTIRASRPIMGTPELYASDVHADDMDGHLYTEIYSRYDALCDSNNPDSFTHWIHKENILGYDSGDNPINHYILRAYDPIVGYAEAYTEGAIEKINYWETKTYHRRILLTAGVHGDEKAAVWALLYFIEELLDSDEKWAEFIKKNFVLDIVPIISPWCYDNDQRYNANDVNLNRNYISPTQPETIALTNYISSISDDIFCAIDCHTTSGNYNFIATPESNPELDVVMQLAGQITTHCAGNWTSTMAELLGSGYEIYSPFIYGCMSVNSGTLPDYLNKSGITNYTATVEGIKAYNSDISDPVDNPNAKANMIKVTRIMKDCICNLATGFLTL